MMHQNADVPLKIYSRTKQRGKKVIGADTIKRNDIYKKGQQAVGSRGEIVITSPKENNM